jgi:hypothetical protein
MMAQINGNVEIFSLNTTNDLLDTTTFNSRFFRTKRNQRLDNNQTDINGIIKEHLFSICKYQSDI